MKIFSPTNLQHLAVESGFYKRPSKLLPHQFFDLVLYVASSNDKISLAQTSGEAMKSHDISLSKQAIDKRFNKSSVAFLKAVLDEVISKQIQTPLNPDFLNKFTKVKIKDSTKFDLPANLKEHFLGFGGKVTSDACICIQYEFDLKTNRLEDVDITSALINDAQDAKETKDRIKKGELIIRDLGYYSSTVIEEIIAQKAFILSKLHSKIIVYDKECCKISFKDLYSGMMKEKKQRLDMDVMVGQKTKIPLRMYVEVVTEQVYQDRIRKREKENKKKGMNMSDEFKARARFNLMVTNISKEDLPIDQIYTLYKTRWQIELIFKTLKSTMGINNVHRMKYHRMICFIYSKLILYLINNQVTTMWNKMNYSKDKRLLSYNKCHKTPIHNFYLTRDTIMIGCMQLSVFIEKIDKLLSKNHWLEKRKNKIDFDDIFNLFICV